MPVNVSPLYLTKWGALYALNTKKTQADAEVFWLTDCSPWNQAFRKICPLSGFTVVASWPASMKRPKDTQPSTHWEKPLIARRSATSDKTLSTPFAAAHVLLQGVGIGTNRWGHHLIQVQTQLRHHLCIYKKLSRFTPQGSELIKKAKRHHYINWLTAGSANSTHFINSWK